MPRPRIKGPPTTIRLVPETRDWAISFVERTKWPGGVSGLIQVLLERFKEESSDSKE